MTNPPIAAPVTEVPHKLVLREEYLSGSVREKLRQAEAAAALDRRFDNNVDVLREHQPEHIIITDIDLKLASPWIPIETIASFCQEVLEVWTHITYDELTSAWGVYPLTKILDTPANYHTFGLEWNHYSYHEKLIVKKMSGLDLLTLSLNQKTPSIRRRRTSGGEIEKDELLTANAIDKQVRLQERFQQWCCSDPEQSERLEKIYNERFNSLRLRSYDGSHLSLNGISPAWRERIQSRQYQLNAIYQGILGNMGAWLEVGLGKTAVAVAIAQERKRIGNARKPVIVVQKSTLLGYAKTIYEMCPQSATLVATEKDCNKHTRQLFMAKLAYSEVDFTVLTHEGLSSLPVKESTKRDYYQHQIDRITGSQRDITNKLSEVNAEPEKNHSIKTLERYRNRLEKKLEKITSRQDQGIYFEDLGVDLLIYDEAHQAKNLGFYSQMPQIAGLSFTQSGRALDFDIKRLWIRQQYGDGRIIQMSGTPIANTLGEVFKLLGDLCPELLIEKGIYAFDAFAATFFRTKTGAEIKTSGKLERTTRLCEVVNVPELMQLFFTVSQVVTGEMVGIERPLAKYITVAAPMSPLQRSHMDWIVERADRIKARCPMEFVQYDEYGQPLIDPETGGEVVIIDNRLMLSTEARKSMLDYRIIDPDAEDNSKSKVNQAIRRISKIWKRTQKERSTQIVFCEFSTLDPKKDFTVYDWMRSELIRSGVPPEEIAIFQECGSDKEKQDLFDRVNAGWKRIIIGGKSLGTGVNVQEKLIAAHILTPPWRPCDLEQWIGRIVRPGNFNKKVLIYQYVTQGVDGNVGFDSFMYQAVATKLKFIKAILSGDRSIRRLEEDASESPSWSPDEIKAIASGDPRLMELANVEGILEQKERLLKSYVNDIYRIEWGRNSRNSIPHCLEWISRNNETIEETQEYAKLVEKTREFCTGRRFVIEVEGVEYHSYKDAGKAINEVEARLTAEKAFYIYHLIGHYGGLEVVVYVTPGSRSLDLRGGSESRLWNVEFWKTPESLGARLENRYLAILERYNSYINSNAKLQRTIDALRQELEAKQQQQQSLKIDVDALKHQQLELQKALGIDPSRDQMAEVDFGAEDSDD